MSKIKKVVLTGGPHSGKSTLIKELKEMGYPIAEEAALLVIEDLNNKIGIKAQIKFRSTNIDEFQNLIYNKQIELENKAIAFAVKYNLHLIICDRGVYDGITYYKLFNKKIDSQLFKNIKSTHYDHVFVCEVLPNFDSRVETGRFETIDTSKKLSTLSYDIYKHVTPDIFWIPVMSVKERLDFIIDSIS